MRTTRILAALSAVATVFASGPPEGVAPDENAPSGCESNSKSNFTIGYTLLSSMKRETAVEAKDNSLECYLKDGILKDPLGRVGSIVANYQLQFDGPPQAGAIYTGGFSVCQNNSLAIGDTTRWWKCQSGNFFNLYDRYIDAQCDEIRIVVTYKNQPSSSSSAGASSTSSSSSGSASSSASASTTPIVSLNSTVTSTSSSGSSSFTSAPATGGASSASASSSGANAAPSAAAAAPGAVRAPRAGTFAAAVGIFGAALLL